MALDCPIFRWFASCRILTAAATGTAAVAMSLFSVLATHIHLLGAKCHCIPGLAFRA